MGIEPLTVTQKIYLKIFLCQYGCHIYDDTQQSEKVLYTKYEIQHSHTKYPVIIVLGTHA